MQSVNKVVDYDEIFLQIKDVWIEFKSTVLPAIEQRTEINKQKQEACLNERKQKEPILPET